MNLSERINTMETLKGLIASPRCEALDDQVRSILLGVEVIDGFNDELIINDVIPFEEVTQWIDDSNYVHFSSIEDEYIFNQCVKYFNKR